MKRLILAINLFLTRLSFSRKFRTIRCEMLKTNSRTERSANSRMSFPALREALLADRKNNKGDMRTGKTSSNAMEKILDSGIQ